MLNLKKLFSEAGKKNKVENFANFEEDLCFSINQVSSVFRIFRPEGSFAKAKK
jgi:hypothetical protein